MVYNTSAYEFCSEEKNRSGGGVGDPILAVVNREGLSVQKTLERRAKKSDGE